VIQDLKEMSPEEKKQVRQHLDKAFKRKQVHDTDTEQDHVLEYMLKNGIELSLENYIDLAYMGQCSGRH